MIKQPWAGRTVGLMVAIGPLLGGCGFFGPMPQPYQASLLPGGWGYRPSWAQPGAYAPPPYYGNPPSPYFNPPIYAVPRRPAVASAPPDDGGGTAAEPSPPPARVEPPPPRPVIPNPDPPPQTDGRGAAKPPMIDGYPPGERCGWWQLCNLWTKGTS